jgi:hypothetical protein
MRNINRMNFDWDDQKTTFLFSELKKNKPIEEIAFSMQKSPASIEWRVMKFMENKTNPELEELCNLDLTFLDKEEIIYSYPVSPNGSLRNNVHNKIQMVKVKSSNSFNSIDSKVSLTDSVKEVVKDTVEQEMKNMQQYLEEVSNREEENKTKINALLQKVSKIEKIFVFLYNHVNNVGK